MKWLVRQNNSTRTDLKWPYVDSNVYPWIVTGDVEHIDELTAARAWCTENSIPFHRIFASICLTSRDHLFEFLLRWDE